MPMQKGSSTEPNDGNEDSDQHRDREPARNLDTSDIEIGKEAEHKASAGPLCVSRESGKIVHEIIHDQHAVEAIQQKCASPVPPTALESPEVAERGTSPAIEATLHGENAVEFGGGERHWYAPEERHEGEEH